MTNKARTKRSFKRPVTALAATVLLMFGFGYALVPLYNLFCEITGIGGKPTIAALQMDADAVAVDPSRELTVEFVGVSTNGLPLDFGPIINKTTVSPGEVRQVLYKVKNLSDRDFYVTAVPSVTPINAARHFVKLECFCFENQKFPAGAERELPVRFYVDAKTPNEVKTISLSYSLFEIEKPKETAG